MRFYPLFLAGLVKCGCSRSESYRFLRRQADLFLKYAEAGLLNYEGRETTVSALEHMVDQIVSSPRAVSGQYRLARVFFDGPEDPSQRGPMDEYLHLRESGKVRRKFGIDMLTVANVNIMKYEGFVVDNTLRENLSRFFDLVSQLVVSSREIEQLYAKLPHDDIPSLVEMIDQMELSMRKYLDNNADKLSLLNFYDQFGISALRSNPKVGILARKLRTYPHDSREYFVGVLLAETSILENAAVHWLLSTLSFSMFPKPREVIERIYDTLVELLIDTKVESDEILTGSSSEWSTYFEWRRNWIRRFRRISPQGFFLRGKLENLVNYVFILSRHGEGCKARNPASTVNIPALDTLLDSALNIMDRADDDYSLVTLADLVDSIHSDCNDYAISPDSIIRVAFEFSQRFGLRFARSLLAPGNWGRTKTENLTTIIAAFIIFGRNQWNHVSAFYLSTAEGIKLEKAASFMSYLVKSRRKQLNEIDRAPFFEPGVWLQQFLESQNSSPNYAEFIINVYPAVAELEASHLLPLQNSMKVHLFLGFPTKLFFLSKRASELFHNQWFKCYSNHVHLWSMVETALRLPSKLLQIIVRWRIFSPDNSVFVLLVRAAQTFLELLRLLTEEPSAMYPPDDSLRCLERLRSDLNPFKHSFPNESIRTALDEAKRVISVTRSSKQLARLTIT